MNIEDLKKEKVKIGNISFTINRLCANDGADMARSLRQKIIERAGSKVLDDEDIKTYIVAILSLDPDFLSEIQEKLFNRVIYNVDGVSNHVPNYLQKHLYDSVFEKLDAFDVESLLVRCLVVNFFTYMIKIQELAIEARQLTEPKTQKA